LAVLKLQPETQPVAVTSAADKARPPRRRGQGLDRRTRAARRLSAIERDLAASLPVPLPAPLKEPLRRVAELTAGAELARGAMLRGEGDLLAIARIENTAQRAARALFQQAAEIKRAAAAAAIPSTADLILRGRS
jgi:hypothetical protein